MANFVLFFIAVYLVVVFVKGEDKATKAAKDVFDNFLSLINRIAHSFSEWVKETSSAEEVIIKKEKAFCFNVYKEDFSRSDAEWHELLWMLEKNQFVWPFTNEMIVKLVDDSSEHIHIVLKDARVGTGVESEDLIRLLYNDLEAYGIAREDVELKDVYIGKITPNFDNPVFPDMIEL